MTKSTREGALSVYGVAAGLCAVLPIPALDTYLGRLARGAGVRRAAGRHGVILTVEARDVLAAPGIASEAAGTAVARVVRGAFTRWNLPANAVSSSEDGISAWLVATLLDHYLSEVERPDDAPLDLQEAQDIRKAIGYAAAEGLIQTGKVAPMAVGRTLQRIGTAIEKSTEDRKASQRVVDSVLDSLADAPEEIIDIFVQAFDVHIRRIRAAGRDLQAPLTH